MRSYWSRFKGSLTLHRWAHTREKKSHGTKSQIGCSQCWRLTTIRAGYIPRLFWKSQKCLFQLTTLWTSWPMLGTTMSWTGQWKTVLWQAIGGDHPKVASSVSMSLKTQIAPSEWGQSINKIHGKRYSMTACSDLLWLASTNKSITTPKNFPRDLKTKFQSCKIKMKICSVGV